MTDYAAKMARLACEYSLQLKPGNVLQIRAETAAEPFVAAVMKQALKMGAYPILTLSIADQQALFYKYAPDAMLEQVPAVHKTIAETVDAMLAVDAETNTRQLTGIDPSRVAKHRKTTAFLKETMFAREAEGTFRWNICPWPTPAMAQDAEMSFDDYAAFVFEACKLNEADPVAAWLEVAKYQDGIVKTLTGTKELRITGKKTDITFGVEGRKWINCNGRHNMPDGEVFTSPVEESVSGEIFFDVPTTFSGVEAVNVWMKMENGRVTDASADKGEDFLVKMLDSDDGARTVGEIAFGLNESITKPSRNILFDEKIGRSIHMAVGSSYPEAGGKNKSGLHWDLIKDMRDGGKAFLDGEQVYQDGVFR